MGKESAALPKRPCTAHRTARHTSPQGFWKKKIKFPNIFQPTHGSPKTAKSSSLVGPAGRPILENWR